MKILWIEEKIALLEYIQANWKKFRYMKLWYNSENHRSQAYIITAIHKNYITIIGRKLRIIDINSIWYIEEVP